jgi:hypothetical protein
VVAETDHCRLALARLVFWRRAVVAAWTIGMVRRMIDLRPLGLAVPGMSVLAMRRLAGGLGRQRRA